MGGKPMLRERERAGAGEGQMKHLGGAKVRGKFWNRCANEEALQAWAQVYCGIWVPTKAVCVGHCAPMEYLWKAYQEPARDLVVWAPRGGGKTKLGAVATLLDLVHKPGCSVRILGGSL